MKTSPPAKRPVGRPKLDKRADYAPVRSFGRIADDLWTEFKTAAEREGLTFTQWVVDTLTARARRKPKK